MVVRNIVLTASLFAALGAAGYYGAGMSAEVTTPVVSTFAEPTAMGTKRNLFISGHSLTDRPMPDMLAGIAENAGMPISWNMQYMAGSSFRFFRRNGPGWQGHGRAGGAAHAVDAGWPPL